MTEISQNKNLLSSVEEVRKLFKIKFKLSVQDFLHPRQHIMKLRASVCWQLSGRIEYRIISEDEHLARMVKPQKWTGGGFASASAAALFLIYVRYCTLASRPNHATPTYPPSLPQLICMQKVQRRRHLKVFATGK
jgi:hypothetical protein